MVNQRMCSTQHLHASQTARTKMNPSCLFFQVGYFVGQLVSFSINKIFSLKDLIPDSESENMLNSTFTCQPNLSESGAYNNDN